MLPEPDVVLVTGMKVTGQPMLVIFDAFQRLAIEIPLITQAVSDIRLCLRRVSRLGDFVRHWPDMMPGAGNELLYLMANLTREIVDAFPSATHLHHPVMTIGNDGMHPWRVLAVRGSRLIVIRRSLRGRRLPVIWPQLLGQCPRDTCPRGCMRSLAI